MYNPALSCYIRNKPFFIFIFHFCRRLTKTLLRCLYDAAVEPCGDDAGRLLSTTVRLLRQPEMERYDCRLGECPSLVRPTHWPTSGSRLGPPAKCDIKAQSEYICTGYGKRV